MNEMVVAATRPRRRRKYKRSKKILEENFVPLPTCWEGSNENSSVMNTTISSSQDLAMKPYYDKELNAILECLKSTSVTTATQSRGKGVQGSPDRVLVQIPLKQKRKTSKERSSDPVKLYAQHQTDWHEVESKPPARVTKQPEHLAEHTVHTNWCDKQNAHFHGQVRGPRPPRRSQSRYDNYLFRG